MIKIILKEQEDEALAYAPQTEVVCIFKGRTFIYVPLVTTNPPFGLQYTNKPNNMTAHTVKIQMNQLFLMVWSGLAFLGRALNRMLMLRA